MKPVVAPVAILAFLVLGPISFSRADFAHLNLQSQPGDFIGSGGNYDVTYQSPNISATVQSVLPNGSPSAVSFFLFESTSPGPGFFGDLRFGTNQLGVPFQAGTYTDAQRADFAAPGHPGLDVDLQGRGANTLTGSFTVHSVSFFNDGTYQPQIGSISVSFEQHAEGAQPALFGSFTFQSSNPLAATAPEPSSLTLLSLGLAGLASGVWRCRKRSAGC